MILMRVHQDRPFGQGPEETEGCMQAFKKMNEKYRTLFVKRIDLVALGGNSDSSDSSAQRHPHT